MMENPFVYLKPFDNKYAELYIAKIVAIILRVNNLFFRLSFTK